MTNWKEKSTGFTLIELLICLALVGTLLAVAIPAIINYSKKHSNSDSAPQGALKASYPVSVGGDWNDDLRRDLRVVCLDGFLYYYAREGSSVFNEHGDESRAIFAPKFDPADRLPMRCPQEAPERKEKK